MFITKSEPVVNKDGKIKPFMEISNGVLLINDKYKFENNKWYFYGDDGKWYYLGIGANPNIEDAGDNIINEELYNNVFEKVEEE